MFVPFSPTTCLQSVTFFFAFYLSLGISAYHLYSVIPFFVSLTVPDFTIDMLFFTKTLVSFSDVAPFWRMQCFSCQFPLACVILSFVHLAFSANLLQVPQSIPNYFQYAYFTTRFHFQQIFLFSNFALCTTFASLRTLPLHVFPSLFQISNVIAFQSGASLKYNVAFSLPHLTYL